MHPTPLTVLFVVVRHQRQHAGGQGGVALDRGGRRHLAGEEGALRPRLDAGVLEVPQHLGGCEEVAVIKSDA